jgi:hypothetical protein
MNPAPCFPITGPRERDGLHERDTAGVFVKTGWGAGAMVRRSWLSPGFADAWWVFCEGARKWRLCQPAGFESHHAGDMP